MTYDEFQTYLMTHLWKTGDQVVIDNLGSIVLTAESELNRTFKMEDRVTVVDIEARDVIWPLPADYRSMRSMSSPHRGEMVYNIPADFAQKKANNCATQKDYTVVNKNLRLIGNITDETPVSLEAWYYANIPNFATQTDGTWLVDEYFDVYLYCVLKHTAPFLREDERLATWAGLFNFAFTTADEENVERKYAGSPLKMKFPSGVR